MATTTDAVPRTTTAPGRSQPSAMGAAKRGGLRLAPRAARRSVARWPQVVVAAGIGVGSVVGGAAGDIAVGAIVGSTVGLATAGLCARDAMSGDG